MVSEDPFIRRLRDLAPPVSIDSGWFEARLAESRARSEAESRTSVSGASWAPPLLAAAGGAPNAADRPNLTVSSVDGQLTLQLETVDDRLIARISADRPGIAEFSWAVGEGDVQLRRSPLTPARGGYGAAYDVGRAQMDLTLRALPPRLVRSDELQPDDARAALGSGALGAAVRAWRQLADEPGLDPAVRAAIEEALRDR